MDLLHQRDSVNETSSVNHLPQLLRSIKPSLLSKDTLLPEPKPGDIVKHDRFGIPTEDQSLSSRPKAGAPIAQVLNDETSLHGSQPIVSSFQTAAPPFSGRLADLLLDPTEQKTTRIEQESQSALIEPTGNNSTVIKLPKPPQLPVKTTKRPRIPPLLQGLHQPPPLPTGRLFPPITSEKTSFANEEERRAFDIQFERTPTKADSDRDHRHIISTKSLEKLEYERTTSGEHASQNTSCKKGPGEFADTATLETQNIGTQERLLSKTIRKRRIWSPQETKDLLVGVSRFGIGNWKRILQCPELTFNGRTAVDLKDRFRVCCPGEGLKQRKSKKKHAIAEDDSVPPARVTQVTPKTVSGQLSAEEHQPTSASTNKQRSLAKRRTVSELPDMTIHGPFLKSTRRARCEFTAEDDENLLKGFEKYGPVWHSMRKDAELGFCSRHPTDLRDRFRTRYPAMYAKAGYKLKRKSDNAIENVAATTSKRDVLEPLQSPEKAIQRSREIPVPSVTTAKSKSSSLGSTLPPATYTSSILNSLDAMPYLSYPLPAITEDVDVEFEHDFGDESPITLNRDILQWADVPTTSSTQGTDLIAGDTGWNLFAPNDFIPPLYGDSSPSSKWRSTDRPSQSTKSAASQRVPSSSLATPTNVLSRHTKSVIPQTPNLPNIVYPHVPASSARNAVHNLPAPADLLLGVDLDKPTSMLDETMGLVNYS